MKDVPMLIQRHIVSLQLLVSVLTIILLCTTIIIHPVLAGVDSEKDMKYVCFADETCHEWNASHSIPSTTTSTNHSNNPLDQCGVYMGPSTLGSDTSLGIYTGITLQQGQLINYPEIAIPLLFRDWDRHPVGYDDDGILWERYIWHGNVVQLQSYDNTNVDNSRAVFVPGVGCTINSVLDMNNLISVYKSTFNNLQYRRNQDPGTGAFTPYTNAETKVATLQIDAGSELFASYGDTWIPDIPGAQVSTYKNLLRAESFLLNIFYSFIEDNTNVLSDDMKQSLYDFVTIDFPIESIRKSLTTLPRHPWSDIEKEIILLKTKYYNNSNDDEQVPVHESVIKLRSVENTVQKGTVEEHTVQKLITSDFMNRQAKRSIEWLQTNAYCQDHIRPDISTIPQAGRGAFATRNLPIGTVVGYSPLIHIGLYGRDIMTIDLPNPYNITSTIQKKYDLIINYSFGHSNSTILLTPYGGMVNYINHASIRNTNQKPNVKVRWPNKELIAHKPWYLYKSPKELYDTIDKIGLSFEYVAITNINEGDEVFMDYGIEWETAWNNHVATYKSLNPQYDNKYLHTSEWNETYFRTNDELLTNPYPPNFEMVCIEAYTSISTNKDVVQYIWSKKKVDPDNTSRRYCSVLSRTIDNDTNETIYTIELIIPNNTTTADDEDNDEEVKEEDIKLIIHNVPAKDSIFLVDKPWTADWLLPNVFRHEIMIPNDRMPKIWLNGPHVPKQQRQEEDDEEEEEES